MTVTMQHLLMSMMLLKEVLSGHIVNQVQRGIENYLSIKNQKVGVWKKSLILDLILR